MTHWCSNTYRQNQVRVEITSMRSPSSSDVLLDLIRLIKLGHALCMSIFIAIRTACPRDNHPPSVDHPAMTTIAWIASCLITGENMVAIATFCTSSKIRLNVSLSGPNCASQRVKDVNRGMCVLELTRGKRWGDSPPPSVTFAATIQIALTQNGDLRCRTSYVSTLASKTGRNVEHP